METAKNLQINVTKENNIGVNWVLYSEADLNNYVTYAQQEGNKLVGSYYTYPGNIIYMCISMAGNRELYGRSEIVKGRREWRPFVACYTKKFTKA